MRHEIRVRSNRLAKREGITTSARRSRAQFFRSFGKLQRSLAGTERQCVPAMVP